MINQVTNLIQWKNIPEDEQAHFDFENYRYEWQLDKIWLICACETAYTPRDDHPYRLVIEPEKFYYVNNKSYNGVVQGHTIQADDYSTIRPATEAEIPEPEKTDEERAVCINVGIRWKGGELVSMNVNNVEIDPKDFLSHIDNLAKVKS